MCVGKERVQRGKLYFSRFLNLKVVQRHSSVIAYRPGSWANSLEKGLAFANDPICALSYCGQLRLRRGRGWVDR